MSRGVRLRWLVGVLAAEGVPYGPNTWRVAVSTRVEIRRQPRWRSHQENVRYCRLVSMSITPVGWSLDSMRMEGSSLRSAREMTEER